MCGIVGLFTSRISANDIKTFTNLLEVDVVRGRDSTGIVTIDKKDTVLTLKEAVPAGTFTAKKEYKEVIAQAERFIIGHNRWATVGDVNDAGAHPFTHGPITLVHNGTLIRTSNLIGDKIFSVDSEMICYELANNPNPVEVLEKLEGAYALVWYNADQETLNFARNTERPLWFANTYGEVLFASEKAMLSWILTRGKTGYHYKPEYKMLPVGKLITHKVNDFTADPEVREFTPFVRTYPTVYRGGNNTVYKGNNRYTQKEKKYFKFIVTEVGYAGQVTGKDYNGINFISRARETLHCSPGDLVEGIETGTSITKDGVTYTQVEKLHVLEFRDEYKVGEVVEIKVIDEGEDDGPCIGVIGEGYQCRAMFKLKKGRVYMGQIESFRHSSTNPLHMIVDDIYDMGEDDPAEKENEPEEDASNDANFPARICDACFTEIDPGDEITSYSGRVMHTSCDAEWFGDRRQQQQALLN